VENEAQLVRLRALGCDEWQGHHFSASVDAAGFENLLKLQIKEQKKAAG
jgi:EAL domain-containing protein (putative c-di-GMP-specific phosphodiesterase class I)